MSKPGSQLSKWNGLPAVVELRSEADTIELARMIAPLLEVGDVLALHGELGAGKTFFTQHLCRALGVTEIVSSPSYVLINQYKGDIPVTHADLYRLSSYEEYLELGLYEMLEDMITVIEWPEIAIEILPDDTLHIYFEFDGSDRRAIIK